MRSFPDIALMKRQEDVLNDVSFRLDGCVFNYRVAAIVREGDSVLLNRIPSEGYWFLPGGRVKIGETARDALVRELDEELGEPFVIGSFVACVENFFEHVGSDFHEVALLFEARRLNSERPITCKAPGLEFQWVSIGTLDELDLRPAELKTHMVGTVELARHILIRRAPSASQ